MKKTVLKNIQLSNKMEKTFQLHKKYLKSKMAFMEVLKIKKKKTFLH